MNEIARGSEDSDRDYFQAVESEFIARRGTPFLLSPKDFGVLRRWKAAGIPLSDVLFGIEEAFRLRAERGAPGRINSLAYCEGSVLEAWERRSSARTGAPNALAGKGEGTGEILDALCEELERAASREREARLPLERALESLLRLRASGRAEEETEESLARIERKLVHALEETLPAEVRRRIEDEIALLLQADSRTMESSALKKTARVLFRRRVRDRYGLPRLTLLP
jgi:hypothetical protein